MSRLLRVLAAWIPFAVLVTAFCALAYLIAQQNLRQGANDPQIQMAEDGAAALDAGATIGSVVPKEQAEFSKSLVPFMVVYDASGKAVASSGVLDGQMPDYPVGALEASKQSGENRVTWQPRDGVRIASVVVPFKQGYVMAGRNMREVEAGVSQTGALVAAAWVATMAAVLVAVLIVGFLLIRP
jgi:hypothetical protein